MDFIIHLITSFLIMCLLLEFVNIRKAFYMTLLIGIFKEQFDVYFISKLFDIIDIFGNIAGVILAVFFAKKI